VLGFCAFLASLASGGGSFNYTSSSSSGDSSSASDSGNDIAPALHQAGEWVSSHIFLVTVGGALIVLIVAVLWLTLLWLSSRGRFMFLDGIVTARAAVKDPWHRCRHIGNSLLRARIALAFISFGALIILGGAGVLIAWPDIAASDFGARALTATLSMGLLLIALILALTIVNALLMDFVTVVMYQYDMSVLAAAEFFVKNLLLKWPGQYILFYLLKIAMGILAGIIVWLLSCLTCCILALPYIHSVAFLPVSVFFKAYSVCFLEQQDPQLALIHVSTSPEDETAQGATPAPDSEQ